MLWKLVPHTADETEHGLISFKLMDRMHHEAEKLLGPVRSGE
jgi:hypothetical protein